MPRPRPPRLQREITRHGRAVWYGRAGKGRRVRIRAEYLTPEFSAEYQSACAAASVEPGPIKGVGTLAWLWDRYRETGAWFDLALATRRKREYIMRPVLEQSGKVLAIHIERKHVVAGRDKRAATPAQAIHSLDAMRGLFNWALDA